MDAGLSGNLTCGMEGLWSIFSKRSLMIKGSHYLLILKFRDFSMTFKDPQISFYKDQFSTEVYSMSSRTSIFNVYVSDDDAVIT